MNKSKYQEALDRIGRNYYLSQESGDFEHFENLYLENKKTLQELVNFTKTKNYYTKQQLDDVKMFIKAALDQCEFLKDLYNEEIDTLRELLDKALDWSKE